MNDKGGALHFIGLVSDGNVHSHIDHLKAELGKAVSVLGKPESYLMLGFEDNYCLYFAGKRLDKGAFVSVELFGAENPDACKRMTKEICAIFERVLGIPGSAVYITYAGFKNWGWNGSNF